VLAAVFAARLPLGAAVFLFVPCDSFVSIAVKRAQDKGQLWSLFVIIRYYNSYAAFIHKYTPCLFNISRFLSFLKSV
jgi:hypothetical protein